MRSASVPPLASSRTCRIWTPLGTLAAASDGTGLVSLGFEDAHAPPEGSADDRIPAGPPHDRVLRLAADEIDAYFRGTLREFTVPLSPAGTPFQQQVWGSLLRIPFGETRSYSAVAASIGRPTAVRATARANGDNPLVIIVPCHRVIGADGTLTGYSAGLGRQRWLLRHEQPVLGTPGGLWSGE